MKCARLRPNNFENKEPIQTRMIDFICCMNIYSLIQFHSSLYISVLFSISQDGVSHSGAAIINRRLHSVPIIMSSFVSDRIAFHVERLCLVRCGIFYLWHVVHVQSLQPKATRQNAVTLAATWRACQRCEWKLCNGVAAGVIFAILLAKSGHDNPSHISGIIRTASHCGNK